MIELLQYGHLEPMKDAPDKTIVKGHSLAGMSTTRERVKDDFYATPPESTVAILKEVALKGSIWEPACGQGHMSEVIKEFYPNSKVYSTDLVDRGYAEDIVDFLDYDGEKFDNIITNPPFKLAKEFIEKALEYANDKVIMFAKIQLLEGVSRQELFKNHPPKYIYVFTKRQNPLRNGSALDENGKKWASTMCFAWFVWEVGFKGEPIVRWV